MKLKTIVYDLLYVYLNHCVANIPFWVIRRFWYRLFGMKIGKSSRINMKCFVYEPWNIIIGHNTIVNEYVVLDGRGGLDIGSSCSISMFSMIYTASHKSNSADFDYYEKKTSIQNGVWIGARAILMPGVCLHDGSIVGANSVVLSGDYEAKGIYVGVPAVKTKTRDVDNLDELRYTMYFR